MKLITALLATLLILTGCSTTKTLDTSTTSASVPWPDHFKSIEAISHWQSNAKIAIKIKKKTQTAKMIWQQENDQFNIEFSGPFGQGGLSLRGNNSAVVLNIAKEAPIKGTTTSKILRERLGWELPVENAKYWILGIPSPLTKNQATLKDERLSTLLQDGWKISYPRYKKFGSHYLPTKITISKGDLNFLIVIYQWNTQQNTVR